MAVVLCALSLLFVYGTCISLASAEIWVAFLVGSISAQDAGIALRTLGKPPSEEDLQVGYKKFMEVVRQDVPRRVSPVASRRCLEEAPSPSRSSGVLLASW